MTLGEFIRITCETFCLPEHWVALRFRQFCAEDPYVDWHQFARPFHRMILYRKYIAEGKE